MANFDRTGNSENEQFLSNNKSNMGQTVGNTSSIVTNQTVNSQGNSVFVPGYGTVNQNHLNKYTKQNTTLRSRRYGGYFYYLLLFFFGVSVGMALFPLFVTFLTARMNNNHHNTFGNSSNLNNEHRKDDTENSLRPPKGLTAGSGSFDTSSTFKPVKFSDIAGMDEAKYELREIVQFLKEPESFTSIGARMPKGLLLVGPPGSGKTMLARAVASEANVTYLYASGPEFVEIYVGQGARRIRDLFESARQKAPCIIFLDELDAVGGKRDDHTNGGGGGNREHDQTLNQLLVELDGFRTSPGIIIVLGATNRIDVLDKALLRPGRFDRIVTVPLPDVAGRELILRKYLGRIKYDEKSVDPKTTARITPGFSGAELENLVNEAAILAARSGKKVVGKEELQEARDKVSMGPPLRSIIMSDEQKKLTAYHEAGHALVAYHLAPHADPVHKATIISRGNALGYVEQMPPDNKYGHSFIQLTAKLAVSMGGRVSENLVFGPGCITNGASSDIANATSLAYRMVTEWGMSDKVGPLYCRRELNTHPPLSQASSFLVEKEVRRLIDDALVTAERILRSNRKQLTILAEALLEKETLSGQEIKELLTSNK